MELTPHMDPMPQHAPQHPYQAWVQWHQIPAMASQFPFQPVLLVGALPEAWGAQPVFCYPVIPPAAGSCTS